MLVLTYVLIVCHMPSIFGLGKLKEVSMPTRELDMDPVAVAHIEMAGAEVAGIVVVDSDSLVPHSKLHKRIEGIVTHVFSQAVIALDATSMCDSR